MIMNLASNKNLPPFNHNNTLIYTKNFQQPFFKPKSYVYIPKKYQQNSLLSPLKTMNKFLIPNQKNLVIKTENSSIDSGKMQSLTIRKDEKMRKKQNFTNSHNSNEIIQYLDTLEAFSKMKDSDYFLPKIKRRKTHSKSELNILCLRVNSKNSPLLASSTIKKQSIAPTSPNLKQESNIRKILKSNLSNIISEQKKNSIRKIKTKENEISIEDYNKLKVIIKKLAQNFSKMNEKYANKIHLSQKIISLIPPSKKYLERLFFLSDRLRLNINESSLESACIIQDSSTFKEKLIKPSLFQDLQELNILFEEHNISKETNEIHYLEDMLKDSLKDLPSRRRGFPNIEKFNFEKIVTTSIIDDLLEGEKNFGNFEFISLREKRIGKVIDDTLKKIKDIKLY